jgi:hypothetical protein
MSFQNFVRLSKIKKKSLPDYVHVNKVSKKELINVIQHDDIVDSSCKKPLVICNSIFSIFLNQIKAQRDQKIIVWIEYFPYKYGFKVIAKD